MGLDMYLRKEQYISTYDFEQKEYCSPKKVKINVDIEYQDGHHKEETIEEQEISQNGGIFVETPFAYWRKVNQIHKWFVDLSGEQDKCQKIYVTGKQLLELVELCKTVLADHSKAEELLPVQEGFFFGSYEYDDWYFEGLEMTIAQLKDVKEEDEFIYQASW